MRSKISQLVRLAGFVCMLTLLSVGFAIAQAAGAAPLTDTQAQELIQRVSTAPPNSKPLTALEVQQLLAYVEGHSQTATAQASTKSITAQAAAATPATLGEKKPGVIRIGIVMPKADLGSGFQGPSAGEPLRGLLTQYLGGPNTQLVPIDALLPTQVEAEAQQKQCDYIVYSSLTQKKTGHGGFLGRASGMAGMVPMMGAARSAGAIAAAANATYVAQQAATLSRGVKAKNEVTLEYKLQAPGNATPLVTDTQKAKASSDGEDVITPMVEKAATAIMAQLTKK